MPTRTSGVVELANSDAKDAALTVRYSTIKCRLVDRGGRIGKKGVIRESALPLLPHFEHYAKVRGLGQHITSIVANYIVVNDPDIVIPDFQLFYTQVWSDIDRYFSCALNNSSHFGGEVADFFHSNPVSAEAEK